MFLTEVCRLFNLWSRPEHIQVVIPPTVTGTLGFWQPGDDLSTSLQSSPLINFSLFRMIQPILYIAQYCYHPLTLESVPECLQNQCCICGQIFFMSKSELS